METGLLFLTVALLVGLIVTHVVTISQIKSTAAKEWAALKLEIGNIKNKLDK